MSLHILAAGTLVAAPQKRLAKNGSEYITGQLRVTTDEEIVLIAFIAFSSDVLASLAKLGAGDACCITGRAKLTRWTAKDGTQAHGLNVVAERVMDAYEIGKKRQVTKIEENSA